MVATWSNMFRRFFAHGNHSRQVIPVFLPKNPDGSQGGSYNIHSDILKGVRSLFDNIGGLVLKPGMKFCRNYAKSGKEPRNIQIRVLQIQPEGSPIFHPSITNEGLDLKHSIFIHKTPEQLGSSQATNTPLANDDHNLGVWLLCESISNNHNQIGIGHRTTHRHETDDGDERFVSNCVVKYMLYLGAVSDFQKQNREVVQDPFTNPQWAVYKRRVKNYTFVVEIRSSTDVEACSKTGIYISESGEDTIIRWMQNSSLHTKSIKTSDMKKNPSLAQFLSRGEKWSTNGEVLKKIKSIAGITGESDFSTFEVMPYLGPSLYDIAEDPKVMLSQKIEMCIQFFEHIASEYEGYKGENPESSTLGFYDIKPDNFSFDIHGTKKCVQNDTKAKNTDPHTRTTYYTAPWAFDRKGSLNQKKSIPARDLYAMGKSVINILQLHQKSQKNSKPLEQLQMSFLKKIADDIMSHATAEQNNKDFDNADYIRATIIPSLKDSYASDDSLFSFAVNYLKEKNILMNDENKTAIEADPEKKNIFTCAVFGAKAYLDQHQKGNDKTTGKDAVNDFLKALVDINTVSSDESTKYKASVEAEIEQSKKGSNRFSNRSRRAIFNTYCPTELTISQNTKTDHIREATEARICNLVGIKDDAASERLAAVLLYPNDSKSLRFKVLEKAIQYLECSEAGWLGKKAVRGLIHTLSEPEEIQDACIIKEVKSTVNACVFFKGINKTRTAFFGDFFKSEGDEQQPQSPVVAA
ncbi:MAG: hypothetical protein KBD83_02220 [Gammaproteobacteria bacterium]|nr:hypothetical protein [Gammaproteobacteria bacterium]